MLAVLALTCTSHGSVLGTESTLATVSSEMDAFAHSWTLPPQLYRQETEVPEAWKHPRPVWVADLRPTQTS